nr:ISWI chromatin-remodeling complex ATPase CHR11 [Ipomoea batatas]
MLQSSISVPRQVVLLDKLLPKLKDGSRMTRLLDILEDYLMYRGHQYCRIDGNTGGEDPDASIEALNKPGSEKFAFLVHLQAQDRAHRIGQKKEVQAFRFCTEYTIEEKVIERAYKKLALDALVIQQRRLAEQEAVNKDELLQMVRFGAEMVFSSKDRTITDEDIDIIIAKGEEAALQLNWVNAIKFKMDESNHINGKAFPKAAFIGCIHYFFFSQHLMPRDSFAQPFVIPTRGVVKRKIFAWVLGKIKGGMLVRFPVACHLRCHDELSRRRPSYLSA